MKNESAMLLVLNLREKYIMMKFTNKFDRTNLKALRIEMQDVMNKYGVKSNLEIHVGNMSFGDAEVSIKIKAVIKGVKTAADHMTEMLIKQSNLVSPNKMGDTIVEFNSRAHKMPWIYKCGKTGKQFKTTDESAERRFAA